MAKKKPAQPNAGDKVRVRSRGKSAGLYFAQEVRRRRVQAKRAGDSSNQV